jgi:4a-hydroxytetrahydrobiopterin dehydratase
MSDQPLAERHCSPCEGNVAPLAPTQQERLLSQLDSSWKLGQAHGHDQITRAFKFHDFVQAVDFVNRITPIAEAEGHHPDLLVRWGGVEVRLWTHVAAGLTENDFILAAQIDRLYG